MANEVGGDALSSVRRIKLRLIGIPSSVFTLLREKYSVLFFGIFISTAAVQQLPSD